MELFEKTGIRLTTKPARLKEFNQCEAAKREFSSALNTFFNFY